MPTPYTGGYKAVTLVACWTVRLRLIQIIFFSNMCGKVFALEVLLMVIFMVEVLASSLLEAKITQGELSGHTAGGAGSALCS